MNREEILERAQKENQDEMEVRVRDQAMRWTYIVMVFAAAVFAFIRSERGDSMMDLCATICFSVAAGQLYRFIKMKGRDCLVLGLIALAMAVFAVVRFCMGY